MFEIDLSWDPVDEPHHEYRIYRDTEDNVSTTSTYQVGTTPEGTTEYTDEVPEEGDITYYYAITAVRIEDGEEYESDASTASFYIPKLAVGKMRVDGSIVELADNKVVVGGETIEIENAKARIDGSIVELV